MYKVVIQSQADSAYQWLFRHNRSQHARIRAAMGSLQSNPYAGKPLAGPWQGCRSLRVGVYRIIYQIEKSILTIYVLDIGHRREIYR